MVTCILLYISSILSEKWLAHCQVEIALPALRQLIHSTDEEILIDTCWALAYFSEGPVDKSRAIIELGVYPRLLQLLQYAILLLFSLSMYIYIYIYIYISFSR